MRRRHFSTLLLNISHSAEILKFSTLRYTGLSRIRLEINAMQTPPFFPYLSLFFSSRRVEPKTNSREK